MDDAIIYERLSNIFHDIFDDDSIVVIPTLSARDVDGWDSLTHIRLLLTIEKSFKVRFTTTEINNLENVQGLVKLIAARH
ncbi:MAG: acyl carrier protein [Gammaproteobacteria bacterium]|jgi:acyl carrier protein|nr:acyl carrier protein [Gammaproteobacteria bacterium]